MKVANIHEAKTHLSKLIEEVVGGEEVIIAKAGKPLVRLIAFHEPKAPKRRKPGLWKGKVWISPDFDKLPDDLLAALEGERP
jgi:prevent-host-death family protein